MVQLKEHSKSIDHFKNKSSTEHRANNKVLISLKDWLIYWYNVQLSKIKQRFHGVRIK